MAITPRETPEIAAGTAKDIPRAGQHGWCYRRVVLPILALLRLGASPERLAWSLAAGVVIGVNPILGSTTLICLAVAFAFRLNIPASQLGTHLMYPIELALLLPFVHVGTRLFGTAPLTLSLGALLDAARHAPLSLLRQIWMWEWHALVVWAIFASLVAPLLAAALTPVLRKLLARVHHGGAPAAEQQP